MKKKNFILKVTIIHVVTYIVCGMLSMTLFDYQSSVEQIGMRDTNSLIVALAPLFQLFRGFLFGIGFSLMNFLIGYIIVTWIGFLHAIFNIKVLHMKSMKESGGKGKGLGEAYNKTKPWHPLYNLIILPIFAYLYFKGLDTVPLSNTIAASILWGTSAIVIDLVGWVLIKPPLSLTFRRFYIEYQPWITIVYLVMYASPFIAYWLIQIL